MIALDLNGDGKTDLVQQWNNNGTLWLLPYVSTGTSLSTTNWINSGQSYGSGPGGTPGLIAMDLNGDGKTDLVQQWNNNGILWLLPYFSSGASLATTNWINTGQGYGSGFGGTPGLIALDINGDGKTDLVQQWNNNGTLWLLPYISNGSTLSTTNWINSGQGYGAGPGGTPGLIALDINGDGRTDLVQQWNNNGTLWLLPYISNGTTLATTNWVNTGQAFDSGPGGPGLLGGSYINPAPNIQYYTIKGQVLAGGTGVAGATVTLSGNSSATTTTDANGNYSFTVPAGGTYMLTPSLAGYSFSPASALFSNLAANELVNFLALLGNSGGSGSVNGFYGLYTPVYATPSGIGCGDLSGTWTEEDQLLPTASWSLTQSGNNVSGTLSKTSCGTNLSWTASGQSTGLGAYSLQISNPSPTQDGCGNIATPSETESLNLSGSNCSQGSANWVSTFGAGTSSWTGQVPTSLKVVSSRVLSDTEMTASGCLPTFAGLYFQIIYQVLDNSSPPKPVKVKGLVPQEQLLHHTLKVGSYAIVNNQDEQPQWGDITPGMQTDSNGQFSDHPFGQCGGSPSGPSPGFNATYTQNIRVVNPKNQGASVILRSNQWTQTAPNAPPSRKGTLTNGIDVNLSQ